MLKAFFTNFFRKDLNLSSRWWHRLLYVIFFCSFILVFVDLVASVNYSTSSWKIVATLEERTTEQVMQIGEIRQPGERVEERDRANLISSPLNLEDFYSDFYCSTDLANQILDIQDRSGIKNLYLNRKSASLDEFREFISNNGIICLIPDSLEYVNWDTDGAKGEIRFLEPLTSDTYYGNELVFFKESKWLAFLSILQRIFLALFIAVPIFIGIAIAYYKVILYVIFGNPKKADMSS